MGVEQALQTIEHIREELRLAAEGGQKELSFETVYEILDAVEHASRENVDAPIVVIEKFKHALNNDLNAQQDERRHAHEWDVEQFRQVIALGQSAMKAGVVINGGAAVALLAFIGHMVGEARAFRVLPFADSMWWFVIGVLASGVAFAATYVSQLGYAGKAVWSQRAGYFFHALAALGGVFALVAFLMGSAAAYHGFLGL